MSKECYVYVIAVKGSELSKVGISQNPSSRVRDLSTASPYELELFHAFRLPDREDARLLELAFHTTMKRKQTQGKWFAMHPQEATGLMIQNIIQFLTRYYSVPEDEVAGVLEGMGMPSGFWDCVEESRREKMQ
jgi:hypothetical protein